jgi:hypothetical protein
LQNLDDNLMRSLLYLPFTDRKLKVAQGDLANYLRLCRYKL